MGIIDIDGIEPIEQLFHNEKIKTYRRFVKFNDISYWDENLRTVLAFDTLIDSTGKNIQEIDLDEITYFLAARDELDLISLAESIENNGVRVPLIILDDGTLLDGNRRYFSCSYIYHENLKVNQCPDVLKNIPVWVIKKDDVDDVKLHKILAEANFVNDMKVPWTLDVKAKVISDYYNSLCNNGSSEQEAYAELKDVYGLSKSKVKEYVETVELTNEYINQANKNIKRKFKFRNQVLKKFVYFWEFRNKGLNGRGELDTDELSVVKPLFFKMIENGCFKNMKQVEPMIRSVRDESLWGMLMESKGTSINQVELLFREKKLIKSSEDKVRNFTKWLDNEDAEQFSKATHDLLGKLKTLIQKINNG